MAGLGPLGKGVLPKGPKPPLLELPGRGALPAPKGPKPPPAGGGADGPPILGKPPGPPAGFGLGGLIAGFVFVEFVVAGAIAVNPPMNMSPPIVLH